MRLPLYFHAAQELLGDAEKLFRSVGETLGPPIEDQLQEFLARSEMDQSLECMGYQVGVDDDGFRYQRNW